MPYLYSLYRRAAECGERILRPTFFDFPEDPATLAENDELMLGPLLLAAPVVEKGARQRAVYLPAGPVGWCDVYAETWHAAGEMALLAAPLERLPLLVPEGAIFPLTNEARDFSRLHDEPSVASAFFRAAGAGSPPLLFMRMTDCRCVIARATSPSSIFASTGTMMRCG